MPEIHSNFLKASLFSWRFTSLYSCYYNSINTQNAWIISWHSYRNILYPKKPSIFYYKSSQNGSKITISAFSLLVRQALKIYSQSSQMQFEYSKKYPKAVKSTKKVLD
jgi:hypothetical protein